MAQLKAIWGPHKTERRSYGVVWWFSGMRAGGTACGWKLTFYYDSRRFRTKVLPQREREAADLLTTLPELPELQRAEIMKGPVTPMLRARLKPEHIAEATRLALKHGGK